MPISKVNRLGLATDAQNYTIDTFTGDGSTVAFTLSQDPVSNTDLIVSVGGVLQAPTTNYSLSGTTLTFTGAPDATIPIMVTHLTYRNGAKEFTPDDGSVTSVKLADGVVTSAKLADGVVTSAKLDTNLAVDGKLDVGGNLNSTGGHAIISDYAQNGLAQNNHTSDNFNLHIADSLASTLSSTYQDDLVDNNIVHSASNVVIEDGQAHLTLLSSSGESTIEFADSRQTPGEMLGQINYYGNTDRMDFAAANTVYLRINHDSGSPKISTQNGAEFYSPSVAVAWYILSSNSGTIANDYNVSSVSNTGTGTYTASYEITVSGAVAQGGMTTRNAIPIFSGGSGANGLGASVYTQNSAVTVQDSEHCLIVFGYRND